MPHKTAKLLDDIRGAADFILEHTAVCSLEEYQSNRVLSAAVERHFIIIGEAISRLTRIDPPVALALEDYPQIIGFRNDVVHGYDVLEDTIVWGIIKNEVPQLLDKVRTLLGEMGE
ncbi:MAG: DUF86 domain-containing protein [Phycisphaerae bacterium]